MKRFALLAALAACGEQTVESIEARPECPLPALELPPVDRPFLMIDDLEDGDMAGNRVDQLDASWEAWKDETAPSPQSIEISSTCAALGRHSYHIRATSPHTGWGASTSLFFRGNPRPQPYDGRQWNAVSFYLAVAPSAVAPRMMRVGVSTMDTAWNGRCTSCVDNFATTIEATHRWQRYVLPFSELKQGGWGRPQAAFKPEEIVQLHVSLDQEYDVWIDHVRFERLPAP